MPYLKLVIFFFCVFALGSCGQKAKAPDGTPVGLIRLQLEDPLRRDWNGVKTRPLVTSLWYPASEGTKMEEVGLSLIHI